MKKKGFTLVELLAVIVVLVIIIAIAIPSYYKIRKNIEDKNFKNKIEQIEIAGNKYSEDTNLSVFFVDDLIKNGYLDADNKDGIIYGFNSDRKQINLNCYAIMIDEIKGINYSKLQLDKEYKENDSCDYNELNNISKKLSIKIYTNGNILNKNDYYRWWTKDDVTLKVYFDNKEITDSSKLTWYSGYDQININNPTYPLEVTTNTMLQKVYTVKYNSDDGKTYSAKVAVYIDKISPQFYENDGIKNNNEWSSSKNYSIQSYDNESGIYKYLLIGENESCPLNKKDYSDGKRKNIFDKENIDFKRYKACVIDNVGNVGSKIVEVKNIDTSRPNCEFEISQTISKGNWYITPVNLKLNAKDYGNSKVKLTLKSGSSTINSDYLSTNDLNNVPSISKQITSNTAVTNYIGSVVNEANSSGKPCSKSFGVEVSITAPKAVNSNNESNYDSVVAGFDGGSAISGIETTKCYLTDSNGNNRKDAVLDGTNCKTNIAANANNVNYNFVKCITSKAGNTSCSNVVKVTSKGYCTVGNYTERKNSNTCLEGNGIKTTTTIKTSKYNSLPCGTSTQTTACSKSRDTYSNVFHDIYSADNNKNNICLMTYCHSQKYSNDNSFRTTYCNGGFDSGSCLIDTKDRDCSGLNFQALLVEKNNSVVKPADRNYNISISRDYQVDKARFQDDGGVGTYKGVHSYQCNTYGLWGKMWDDYTYCSTDKTVHNFYNGDRNASCCANHNTTEHPNWCQNI